MNVFEKLDEQKPDRLCPIKETSSIVGNMSKSSIYAKIAEGTFPKPIPLSPKRVAWSFNDLQQWISERKAAA